MDDLRVPRYMFMRMCGNRGNMVLPVKVQNIRGNMVLPVKVQNIDCSCLRSSPERVYLAPRLSQRLLESAVGGVRTQQHDIATRGQHNKTKTKHNHAGCIALITHEHVSLVLEVFNTGTTT